MLFRSERTLSFGGLMRVTVHMSSLSAQSSSEIAKQRAAELFVRRLKIAGFTERTLLDADEAVSLVILFPNIKDEIRAVLVLPEHQHRYFRFSSYEEAHACIETLIEDLRSRNEIRKTLTGRRTLVFRFFIL